MAARFARYATVAVVAALLASQPCAARAQSSGPFFPVTYAAGGRQYVAASTGRSMSSTDNMRLTPELRPGTGNNIFVFALPATE